MVKISNHLGTINISPQYIARLVADEVAGCFGILALDKAVISERKGQLGIKLYVVFADDINIPAVSESLSHKVAYALVKRTGAAVAAVDIYGN